MPKPSDAKKNCGVLPTLPKPGQELTAVEQETKAH